MKQFFIYPVLFALLGFIACQPATDPSSVELENQIAELRQQLEDAKAKLAADAEHPLVHLVFFQLKEEADPQGLISEIEQLEEIEVLYDLEVGNFKDLKDKRALSEFGVVMQMQFKNEGDYQTYQAHPLHLQLKENAGPYLAGPPVTYDYWME